ncbi:hypothetical protein DPMN_166959 [Dreissena polymorpha]|uniref:Uncharacterized protein n=1 Tax=Dreissena polymorpha TaxID=45954 RepID=A0A9D4IY36_DREPO|nr:hypothetical protein DPMN_166959 [Dreissena polymorpha]
MCSSPDKLSVHWDMGRNSKLAPIHHGKQLKVTYTSLKCGCHPCHCCEYKDNCPCIGIRAGTLNGLRYTLANR